MPNHVHAIMTPADPDGLRRAFADLHRRYMGRINARHQWTGDLWRGRFGSVAMDEAHLIAAVRYVTVNPVRARLVQSARDRPWSSVHAHLAGRDDRVVKVGPMLDRVGDFGTFRGEALDEEGAYEPLRRAETTGRPLGGGDWIAHPERLSGRTLAPQKRGPKPRATRSDDEGRLIGKLSP